MNQQQNCSLALTSMILGLVSFFLGFLTGIPAIITGHIARNKIKSSNGILRGSGFALSGLILGYFMTLFTLGFAIILIFSQGTGVTPFAYTQ